MGLKMYDNINPAAIPAGTIAAGYVDGKWPTYQTLAGQGRPNVLSIAVFPADDAECLDVEAGDATPAQAPAWVARQAARGVQRPVVYTSLSQAATVLQALAAAGIARSQVRLWLAHYTGVAHICSPSCGLGLTTTADGTQWTDQGPGGCDVSLLADDFFATPLPAPAAPVTGPPIGDAMLRQQTGQVQIRQGWDNWIGPPVNAGQVLACWAVVGPTTVPFRVASLSSPSAGYPNGRINLDVTGVADGTYWYEMTYIDTAATSS